jgi:hypothetical protein
MFSGAPDEDAGGATAISIAAAKLVAVAASNPFFTKRANVSLSLLGDGGPRIHSPLGSRGGRRSPASPDSSGGCRCHHQFRRRKGRCA